METIRLDHVARHFGAVRAVDDVSFAAAPGEVLALAGHNGAGKTTILKMLAGLARPSAGTVRILGRDPAREAEVRRALGFLPEQLALSPALSGAETLDFYLRLKGLPPVMAGALLERVGLGDAARRRVHGYSKGMRQRLGLAQAIAGQPRLLLLDEPTTGLDPALRQEFYAILGELAAAGATILLSTHALSELEGRIGRILILHRGKLVADGDLDHLRALSRLPGRIRLVATNGKIDELQRWLGRGPGVGRRNGHALEFEADEAEKAALLSRLKNESPPLATLDLVPPGLDALYAHFLGQARP